MAHSHTHFYRVFSSIKGCTVDQKKAAGCWPFDVHLYKVLKLNSWMYINSGVTVLNCKTDTLRSRVRHR